MTAYILRRPKLGRTSCNAISGFSNNKFPVIRHDRHKCPEGEALVFRWGCTADIPNGQRVVNAAKAIHLASNKTAFRRFLNQRNLCPPTWFSLEGFRDAHTEGTWTAIIRPQTHHQGRHLYVAKSFADLRSAFEKCGSGAYISEFIDKVAEYRIFCCQGRVGCVARKTPADAKAIAWNVAQGGRFDNVRWDDWPLKACKIALEAHELSGLDFSGVDVMVDRQGRCFILEINSAPSLTSEYRQRCFARMFDYIVANGKEKIPLIETKGGYTKFIHPAITDKARI